MSILKATCEYKNVNGVPIKIDVYPVPNAAAKTPAIFYIHGGALISGNRYGGDVRAQWYNDAGFAVFSVDYRLAPETKLPDIVEDVEDALKWARSEGAALFNVDPDRIACIGSSGGGYLALVTGLFAHKPQAIVSFYGYGDLLGDWYCKPDEFYRRQPLVSAQEAYGMVGAKGRVVTEGNRGRYYLYCRQKGIWTTEVSGYDFDIQRDKIVPFCPEFNVTKDYPPTFLFHGDHDTDVPYEQSVQMAAEFKKHGVEYQFVTIPGGGHGCDWDASKPEVPRDRKSVV
jgi:acetyl esterase/lipase